MQAMNVAQVASAGLLGFGLLTAHYVGDYWAQTQWESTTKGDKSPTGRAACLTHVMSYTATNLAFVIALWIIFRLPITLDGVLVGQVISAVTHYWADRRFTLERLANALGKGDFYKLGQPRQNIKAVRVVQSNGVETVSLRPKIDGDATDPISWDNPTLGTGAHMLDQSWHIFWIFIATIVTVVIP